MSKAKVDSYLYLIHKYGLSEILIWNPNKENNTTKSAQTLKSPPLREGPDCMMY